MPRRSSADLRTVDAIAHAQLGLITSAQLLEAGVSRSTTQRRIRTGGPWQRLLPATYLVHAGPPELDQRRLASLLYVGAPAALTGAHALHVRGLVTEPEADVPIDVLVPHHRSRRDAGFVRVERTRREPGGERIGHLYVASAPRAAVDAARRLTRRSDVDALLARVVQHGGATVPELAAELRSAHRRTTALVKDAIESLLAGTRSAPEAELRRLWAGSGLPEPWWNPDLFTPDGAFLASPDAYVEEVGLAVEVESREFHYAPADWYTTLQRQSRVAAHGIVFVQVAPRRLFQDGERAMTEIVRAVREHEGRRTPRIVVKRRQTG